VPPSRRSRAWSRYGALLTAGTGPGSRSRVRFSHDPDRTSPRNALSGFPQCGCPRSRPSPFTFSIYVELRRWRKPVGRHHPTPASFPSGLAGSCCFYRPGRHPSQSPRPVARDTDGSNRADVQRRAGFPRRRGLMALLCFRLPGQRWALSTTRSCLDLAGTEDSPAGLRISELRRRRYPPPLKFRPSLFFHPRRAWEAGPWRETTADADEKGNAPPVRQPPAAVVSHGAAALPLQHRIVSLNLGRFRPGLVPR